MLHHLVTWFRTETREGQRCWARWIGRNWARLNYATRVEPTWLELNCHHVPVQDLPAAFAGLKIVQLSDFHCGRKVTSSYLNEAVDLAMAQRGDLVVLTGDFVHKGHRHVERVADVLSRLSAPLGVFAVLGNHDFSVRNAFGLRRHRHLHRTIADALAAKRIRVLRNETVPLTRDGARLNLTGVDDLWSRVCDLDQAFSGLCRSVPRVVLAHNPRTVEQLDGQRCDLMLSGHTHGGQVSLPGLGPVTLGAKVRRFAAGMYVYRNTYLYVNKGVGFGFPLRYGVRPEVAVLTLGPKQEQPRLEIAAGA
jgi:predicted MPP superfamily phosphohydrolase